MNNGIPASTMKELRSVLTRWAILLILIGAFSLWATWRMRRAASNIRKMPAQLSAPATQKPSNRDKHAQQSKEWYRCTMPECGDQGSADPNSRCPVCGMKRGRIESEAMGGDSDIEIKLSQRAIQLAEIATESVEPRMLIKRIRTVGRVGYDETRDKMVSAWIDGRIDKLYADFTGMTVNKDDHLVEVYSPELLSAQEEYLQAVMAAKSLQGSQTTVARRSAEQVQSSARRKLELLGINAEQIAQIENSQKPQTHLVIHAPIGGTILKKQAMEGMYVSTGDSLYTIADLTHLWLLVDLYESDLPWVKPFQKVRVTSRALPGDVFTGEIVFVDPRVDPQTRTVQVRIHLDNRAMRIKPDMWVAAEIDAGLDRDGRGAVPAPDGQFACPMHPWETADIPGVCPVCEMRLLPVEELPQYTPPTDPSAILAVPRDAVMQTGERALVYVETAPATYRGVEVTLGPLARDETGGEFFAVLSGLQGGENVVTRGNFAIDSQMQLAGKPSLFMARGMQSSTRAKPFAKKQATCPIMGGEIDPEVYTDYRGVRIYFCCPPCIDEFLAAPKQHIVKLPQSIQAKLSAAKAAEANDD